MALTDFKPQFSNAYEEVFQKVLVSKAVANFRFEPVLKFGESLERVILDFSSVLVRPTVRGAASTIDSLTDSSELLPIDLEDEIVFQLSDGEMTQAGPLNPAEFAGGETARKLAVSLDGRFFAQVKNAANTFDNGDLTTLASSGTPITETTGTVPTMVSRMGAKLSRANNISLNNLCYVTDSYGLAIVMEYLISKNIDLAGEVFANGYKGKLAFGAEVYVSENLTGEAVITDSGTFADGETFTTNGITFTMKTALTPTAGEIVIGASLAASMTNIAAALNTPQTTTATYSALTGTTLTNFQALNITATASATTVTVVARGSGALTVSETGASTSWSSNFIHAYYGKKGAIDMAIMNLKEVDMRPASDRRATNIFSSYLGGIKTFADGAKKFLDVKLAR